jgi:hypothetical protein
VWRQYKLHAQVAGVDPIPKECSEAQRSVDDFLGALYRRKVTEAKFKETRAVMSRFFASSKQMNVNSFTVKNMSQQIHKNPATSSKARYDSSYHNGQVFHFYALLLEEVLDNRKYENQLTSIGRVRYPFELLAVVLATMLAVRADSICRGADMWGLLVNPECMQALKRGDPVEFLTKETHNGAVYYTADWDLYNTADRIGLRMDDTKMKKGRLGHWIYINRTRRHRVVNHRNKDAIYLIHLMGKKTQHLRDKVPAESQNFFINFAECALKPRATTKWKYVPECGGHCGHVHAMSRATINKWCKVGMQLAGVDTDKYTSHAIRGNVECAMIAASAESDRFDDREALRRSGHSLGTYENNYKRPPHQLYLRELKEYRQRRDLLPEEAIRLGGHKAARTAYTHLMLLNQAK